MEVKKESSPESTDGVSLPKPISLDYSKIQVIVKPPDKDKLGEILNRTHLCFSDLVLDVYSLYKMYNIDQFEKLYALMLETSGCPREMARSLEINAVQLQPFTQNPGFLYLLRCSANLYKSFRYPEYTKNARTVRQKFFASRRDYQIQNLKKQVEIRYKVKLSETQTILAVIRDMFDYMHKFVVEDHYFKIEFEDFDGSIKTIEAIKSSETEDIVQKFSGYWSGLFLYDTLRVEFFFDRITREWVAVPIELIKSIQAHNKSRGIPFEDGGFFDQNPEERDSNNRRHEDDDDEDCDDYEEEEENDDEEDEDEGEENFQ